MLLEIKYGVEVFSDRGNNDPVAIAQAGIAHAKANGNNVVIIDTAGRLAVDEAMMNEISNIHKAIQASRNLVCCRFYDRTRCCKYSKGF